MSSSNQKRIAKELEECTKTPPAGTKISLVSDADLFHWDIVMDGPSNSVFAGGKYKILLTLPSEYPFKPPTVSFKTKIYHPNVSNDDKGYICLSLAKPDTWKPPNRIKAILEECRNLLITPNIDDPVEASIADIYKNNRKEYEKTAKDWVKKYASGK